MFTWTLGGPNFYLGHESPRHTSGPTLVLSVEAPVVRPSGLPGVERTSSGRLRWGPDSGFVPHPPSSSFSDPVHRPPPLPPRRGRDNVRRRHTSE